MSKTILADIEGFTPVMDGLSNEVGLTAAAVFGRVWRYCQMDDEICYASQKTIAEFLGIDEDTVSRATRKLVESGYLEEIKRKGQTSVFKDTGKVGLTISVGAKYPQNTGGTYRKIPEVPTAKHGTKKEDKESDKDISPKPILGTKTPAITEFKTVILADGIVHDRGTGEVLEPDYVDCNEDGLEVKPKKVKKERPVNEPYELALAIADVTGMSIMISRKQLIKEAMELTADPRISPELVRMLYSPGGVWYKQDWRGKQGQKPRIYDIRETIFTFQPDESNVIKGGIKDREVKSNGRGRF